MYEVTEVEEIVTLTVKNVKTENQGNYYAQLINDAGTTNSNKATLTVNRGPVFTKVPEPFEPIKPNESVKIEVVVEASPKPTINWILNGKEISAKDNQIVKDIATDTYSLTIPKINPSLHAGRIVIKASNVVGTVQHEVKLDILGFYF